MAHQLLKTALSGDQNHKHWLNSWMHIETAQLEIEPYSIHLRANVYITFVPFEQYSSIALEDLEKTEKKEINTAVESQLIDSYKKDGYTLLKVHHNRRRI